METFQGRPTRIAKDLEGKPYEELLSYKLPKYFLAEGAGFWGVTVVREKSCIHMRLGTLLDRKTTYFDAQAQRVILAFIFLNNHCKAMHHHH